MYLSNGMNEGNVTKNLVKKWKLDLIQKLESLVLKYDQSKTPHEDWKMYVSSFYKQK